MVPASSENGSSAIEIAFAPIKPMLPIIKNNGMIIPIIPKTSKNEAPASTTEPTHIMLTPIRSITSGPYFMTVLAFIKIVPIIPKTFNPNKKP